MSVVHALFRNALRMPGDKAAQIVARKDGIEPGCERADRRGLAGPVGPEKCDAEAVWPAEASRRGQTKPAACSQQDGWGGAEQLPGVLALRPPQLRAHGVPIAGPRGCCNKVAIIRAPETGELIGTALRILPVNIA